MPIVQSAEALIRRAAQGGAAYVQTPENTAIMELKPELVIESAKTEEGCVALARFRALAAELGIVLHIGSLAIKLDETRVANRSYLIDPEGDLPRVTTSCISSTWISPAARATANRTTRGPAPPQSLPTFPSAGWGFRSATISASPLSTGRSPWPGAEFIAIPAAFTRQTGEAHWHVLIRARAIETGTFVLAAAQGGLHENGRTTFGHSLIVSPWGEILAEGGEDPGVIFADIDLAASAEARARIPALKHGRDFEVQIAGPSPRAARREAS